MKVTSMQNHYGVINLPQCLYRKLAYSQKMTFTEPVQSTTFIPNSPVERTEYCLIPNELEELQRPWVLPGKFEGDIRFGSHLGVAGIEGEFMLYRYETGGGGTLIAPAMSEEEAAEFRRMTNGLYFEDGIEPGHATRLKKYLKNRGISLTSGYDMCHADRRECSDAVIDAVEQVLVLLPNSHLTSETFQELCLGGWGTGGAKGSQYDEGRVHLFTFATSGPKRNLYGLLLHEIGHSFCHKMLQDGKLEEILEYSRPIHKETAILGIDFLQGPNFRVGRQLVANEHLNEETIQEFVAETYLAYVSQGSRLRKYIADLPREPRRAWQSLLQLLKREFDGRVYV